MIKLFSKEEFESRIEMVPFSGCWIWMGSIASNGYGDFRRGGQHYTVHRYSYCLYKGNILNGLHVLHRCDVRPCCNPDHLFLGTNADNIRDANAKGKRSGPRNRRKGIVYIRRSNTAYDSARKVTPEQRTEIRKIYAAGGVSMRKLAERYSVSYRAMWGYIQNA